VRSAKKEPRDERAWRREKFMAEAPCRESAGSAGAGPTPSRREKLAPTRSHPRFPLRDSLRVTSQAAWTEDLYAELRRMADGLMAGERGGHTLEPTALANEVWLRLRASRNAGTLERGAFLGLAAQAMRRILTDHARRRATGKRGAAGRRTTLDGKPAAPEPIDFALDLDAALTELERIDPELARVVELRWYAAGSTDEVAATLGISPRTVKRRWRFARAWLHQRMAEGEG